MSVVIAITHLIRFWLRTGTIKYFTQLFQVMSICSKSCQIVPSHVKLFQVMSNCSKSCQIFPSHVKFFQVMSNFSKSCQIFPIRVNIWKLIDYSLNQTINSVCTDIDRNNLLASEILLFSVSSNHLFFLFSSFK